MVDSRVLEVIVAAAVLLLAAGEDALKAHFPEASHLEGRGGGLAVATPGMAVVTQAEAVGLLADAD